MSTAYYNDIAMQAKQNDERDQEQLSGFIFMCNGRTKTQCYMYRVFGLPAGKLDVVEKIKPGMKLFLFDFENQAWNNLLSMGGFLPRQVRFKIYSACLPLHESSFRCAIENNYQKGFKFKQELNKQQVGSLLLMFRPLPAPAPGSMQPMLLQPVENQLRLTFSKDSFPQILESQKFQQTRLQQGLCHPMDPNVTGLQLNIQYHVPFPEHHYFGSTENMGHSHPTVVKQVFLTQNHQYYKADVKQPCAVGNPTQTMPDQYNSYGTMGINQQLSTGNIYQSALQREGETVQQQDSAIQYYNPNTSHVVTHATPSVMSSMPTMGVPKVANRTLPLGYLRPFPTHH
ncbi:hypothetical protein ES288_A09G290700v1 [Gossypium darwinii]|uniref:DCD domain-containing protein n=1 Tax=Gossypium darwinii TaxID=34276 RepID=A0A5D2FER6_GOSDA|nr:hypothetical protein ES288_A09G290700v1 [Gossypium darwinii]